jgi:hypothetical protein
MRPDKNDVEQKDSHFIIFKLKDQSETFSDFKNEEKRDKALTKIWDELDRITVKIGGM